MKRLIVNYLVSIIVLFLYPGILPGQEGLSIAGTVYDSETLLPLPYASVHIEGASIGIATNIEGLFELNIPEEFSESLIKVSFIGYKSSYISARTVDSLSLGIFLEPLDVLLGEVVVKARKTSAEEIINRVLRSIPENYENRTNMLNCFYREITYLNNREVNVTEALLDVYKPGYFELRETDQIKINKVRNVGGSLDSGFNFVGGASYRISDDVIAMRPGFLDKHKRRYYQYKTRRVLGSADERIFVISFQADKGAVNRELAESFGFIGNTYDETRLLYSGEIYIREKDYAILKVEYWLPQDQLQYADKLYLTEVPDESVVDLKSARFTVEYRKLGKKYYLYYTNGQISFRIGNRNNSLSENYKVFNELLTVDRDEADVQKFDSDEISGFADLVTDFQEAYEPDFWKDENIVQAYSRLYNLGNMEISEVLFKDMLADKLIELRAVYPLENLFLHTDRNRYISGDIVYFKAYVTEELTASPSFLSKSFYVLLADSSDNIMEKVRFQLIAGIGHGSLKIPSTLEQGVYKLISFPSLMQNFDAKHCFSQSIKIEDEISFIEGVKTIEENSLASETGTDDIDIQFLAEGGNLITGQENNIAVCAVSTRGKPASIYLELRDKNHNILDTIKTNTAGLGKFNLSPVADMSYYAIIFDSAAYGIRRYSLPESTNKGIGLQIISNKKNHLYVKLNSASNQKKELKIVLVKNNMILCSEDLELKGNGYSELTFNNTSTGIATLTVFQSGEPVAERLVFLDCDQRLSISSDLEYGAYPTREKMTLGIKVSDQSGNPVECNLSFAIVDSINCISNEFVMKNIHYSFWLSSNLKESTPVHIPMAVLNRIGSDSSKLLSEIDLLLLTYGWRKYSTGNIFNKDLLINYIRPLNYDLVHGKVGPINIKKKKKEIIPEIQVFETSTLFAETVYSDRTGNFSFRPESFLFNKELIWNFGFAKAGRKWQISFDSDKSSEYWNEIAHKDVYDYSFGEFRDEYKADMSFDPGIFTKFIQLPEVIVTRHVTDRTEDRARLAYSLRNIGNTKTGTSEDIEGLPDLEAIINSIQSPKKIRRLSSDGPIFRVYFRSPNSLGRLRGTSPPALFVVDDVPLDPLFSNGLEVENMPPVIIDRVTIISGPQAFAFFGEKAMGGAVMIYTKDAEDIYVINKKDEGIVITPPLCNSHKEFYKPNYYDEATELDRADYRLTLHWEPEVVTNSDGEARIDFFNAGYNSYVTGIIQGMSISGEPVSLRIRYRVVKEE